MPSWINAGYSWISSELLTHLGFLLALVFLANLFRQKRSPSSTIAWLLIILLLPYVGVPLYVMLGGRKMNPMARRKARIYSPSPEAGVPSSEDGIERLLASYGVPPARAGNCVEVVLDGVDAYQRVIRLIDEARSTIHITTYILGNDEGSRSILGRLTERVSEGIVVRLLIDDLGSWRLRRRVLAPLIEAGAGGLLHAGAPRSLPGAGESEEPSEAPRRGRPDRADRRHEPGLAVHGATGML